jgi:hypothetical protein
LLSYADFTAAIGICLPGYANNELGLVKDPSYILKAVKSVAHPLGFNRFSKKLETWRSKGGFERHHSL